MNGAAPQRNSPNAPKFWKYEAGELLQSAILAYMNGERLTVRDVALIRGYLRRWLESPVWDSDAILARELPGMRERARRIGTESDIRNCVTMMVQAGLDPL